MQIRLVKLFAIGFIALLMSCSGGNNTSGINSLTNTSAYAGKGIVSTDDIASYDRLTGNTAGEPDNNNLRVIGTGTTNGPSDCSAANPTTANQGTLALGCAGRTGVPGVTMSSNLRCVTVIGQQCAGKISLRSNDERNLITNIQIANATAGGAAPTINLAGEVSWTPNATDVATRELTVTVTQQTGVPTVKKVAVDVLTRTVVFTTTLVPGQDIYTDPDGVVKVKVYARNNVPLSGTLTVYQDTILGAPPSYSMELPAAEFLGMFLEYPKGFKSSTTSSGLNRAIQRNGSQLMRNAVAPGLNSNGYSIFDELEMGVKLNTGTYVGLGDLFTTRTDVQQLSGTGSYILFSNKQVIQIDSTCGEWVSPGVSDCQKAGAPVILIHGFTPELLPMGGGVGTWGALANKLYSGDDTSTNSSATARQGHDVFEFRWETQMRFEEAAGRLSQLISRINDLTGKKPIIIAHSFGGIVSNLALSGQGIVWDGKQWAFQTEVEPKVARLITLGSPVSGVNDLENKSINYGNAYSNLSDYAISFVVGRDGGDWTINTCASITCVQAGAFDSHTFLKDRNSYRPIGALLTVQPDWHDALYWIKRRIDPNNLNDEYIQQSADRDNNVLHLKHGESIARLKKFAHSVDTRVVIGLSAQDDILSFVDLTERKSGDYLISYRGQIHPADQTNNLLALTKSKLEIVRDAGLDQTANSFYPISHLNTAFNRSYYILPNGRHTAFHADSVTNHGSIAEPHVPTADEDPLTYCKGLTFESHLIVSQRCNATANVVPVKHFLLGMNQTGGLLDLVEYITPPTPWLIKANVVTDEIPAASVNGENIFVFFDNPSSTSIPQPNTSGVFVPVKNGQITIDLNNFVDTRAPNFDRTKYSLNLNWGNAWMNDVGIYLPGSITYGTPKGVPISDNLNTMPNIVFSKYQAPVNIAGTVVANASPAVNASLKIKLGENLVVSDFETAIQNTTTSRTTSTNSTGGFSITGIRPGRYTILVQSDPTQAAAFPAQLFSVYVSATGATLNLIIEAIPPIATYAITDTGITSDQCYGAGSDALISCTSAAAITLNDKQDGMVGRDVTTPNNADGKLGYSYSTVGSYPLTDCVKDNVTGLLWEGKPTTGPRANTLSFTNLGNNAANDTSGYVAMVNSAGLCGYTDWRLPTAKELQSIVDYGIAYPGPTVDSAWFPNTGNDNYWTSLPAIVNAGAAWTVDFDGASIVYNSRNTGNYIRLVRGTTVISQYSYSIDGSEVIDNITGLVWRRCVEGMIWNGAGCSGAAAFFTHNGVHNRAKNEATNSGKPWRVPNVKELFSITKLDISYPSFDHVAFPATPNPGYFWSSSPSVGYSGNAWNINNAGELNINGRDSQMHLRLVR